MEQFPLELSILRLSAASLAIETRKIHPQRYNKNEKKINACEI
jgi:hypothetical protein